MKSTLLTCYYLALVFLLLACEPVQNRAGTETKKNSLLEKYTTVRLTADLSYLTDNQKELIKKLIAAAEIMDELFWFEAYGDKSDLIADLLTRELQLPAANIPVDIVFKQGVDVLGL